MHQYWGFGLNISSAIEFPELLQHTFDKPDVSIVIGSTQRIIDGKTFATSKFSYELADNILFFEAFEVAKYNALNGDTIIVEPNQGVTDARSVRLFILATVMASILLQRKLLPLHASAILQNNGLTLITGDSGAGKSTTLAGLVKNGYTVFSDDIVVIQPSLKATACYPMIKLWEDAQEKVNHEQFADRSFVIRKGMNKYGVFFHDSFDTGSYAAKKILILKKGDVQQIETKRLVATEAFNEVNRQIYRPVLLHNNSLRQLAFGLISRLVNTCEVYVVTRPANCHPDELLAKVESLQLSNG